MEIKVIDMGTVPVVTENFEGQSVPAVRDIPDGTGKEYVTIDLDGYEAHIRGIIGQMATEAALAAVKNKVDKTTTVNGHALQSNVEVTKGDVELGNVDNTSDMDKPVSRATQSAINDIYERIASIEPSVNIDGGYPESVYGLNDNIDGGYPESVYNGSGRIDCGII